jgi:hypothetical protein
MYDAVTAIENTALMAWVLTNDKSPIARTQTASNHTVLTGVSV